MFSWLIVSTEDLCYTSYIDSGGYMIDLLRLKRPLGHFLYLYKFSWIHDSLRHKTPMISAKFTCHKMLYIEL